MFLCNILINGHPAKVPLHARTLFIELATLILLFAISFYSIADARAATQKPVTFYRAYGYLSGDAWVVPMRIWVRENRRSVEGLAERTAAGLGKLSPAEIETFRFRIRDFLADDESREEVVFRFDNDPEDERYRLKDDRGRFPKTDLNGIVEGAIEIPAAKAERLLDRQASQNGRLTFRAVSKGHIGTGRVRLVEPVGLSVISDIDDTVKITEIPAGPQIVVRNTFFREFTAAPGMASMYREWEGASFHYVSGGPRQLYGPLSEFLFSDRAGFPEGTLHMKNVGKNLLSSRARKDLTELIVNENVTLEQKISQITEIIERFPKREFILVGDSGEKDPEVYRIIKGRFPGQVREIRIRDVVNDREKNKGRLEGMTVIEAPTVAKGVSQFGG